MRTQWVKVRKDDKIKTQLHYAKKGIITPEMEYVANIEHLTTNKILKEIAKGRLILPSNVNHTNLEPMGIGIATRTKINSNIGSSALASSIEEEVEKTLKRISHGQGINRQALEVMANAIVRKLNHDPIMFLKEEGMGSFVNEKYQ